MAKIKIATGIKTYEIENENGEIIGVIKFNPSDANLFKRVEHLEQETDRIKAYIKEALTPDATDDVIKDVTIKADDDFKTAIDDVFGKGTSNAVFGSQNVFNQLDGKTFLERFIDAILPIVKADIEASQTVKNEKISKYLDIVNIDGANEVE